MRITPENCLALCVDYQTRLVPAMHGTEPLIHASSVLLKGLNVLDVPVLVTQQYTKGLGETVPEIKEAAGSAPVFEKVTFSCWHTEEIRSAIEASGRKTILVFGIEAHVCVLQTVIDLRQAGYDVVYVQDCVDSRKPSDREAALRRAAQEGAVLTSCESLLFELTATAKNPCFKQISALVK